MFAPILNIVTPQATRCKELRCSGRLGMKIAGNDFTRPGVKRTKRFERPPGGL
jgi:hypothetical protein